MKNQYHILNGDSLRQHFPKQIEGEIIVARECLVDGDVNGNSMEEFYNIRARFITELYGIYSIDDYYNDSVTEFEKIKDIPENSEINLWFEDDLFCQVNFWFTINLIVKYVRTANVFLIRPSSHTQYGFGGLNESELILAFKERIQLAEIDKIASLWNSYQKKDMLKLVNTAKELEIQFPFIIKVVNAHIDRIPNENSPGRPIQSLKEIIKELKTESFEPVFKEFNKRESIYGFGDLQVKRLLNDILNKH